MDPFSPPASLIRSPEGSPSIRGPLLRMLSEDPDEHGHGAKAVEIARLVIERVMAGQSVKPLMQVLAVVDGARPVEVDQPKIINAQSTRGPLE